MSHRVEQVGAVIQDHLGRLLLTEFDTPKNCLITITGVEVSKDLRHATVGISVLPAGQAKKVVDRLDRAAGHLQFLLNKKLSLKPLPRLRFRLDLTERRAAEIDQLINQAVATLPPDTENSEIDLLD